MTCTVAVLGIGSLGAHIAAVDEADVVITMVADEDALQDLYTGDRGDRRTGALPRRGTGGRPRVGEGTRGADGA